MTSKRKSHVKTFALLATILLSACSNQQSDNKRIRQIDPSDLKIVAEEKLGKKTFYVLYNPDTMEMYTFLKYDGNVEGQLESMNNADGTPILFSPEDIVK